MNTKTITNNKLVTSFDPGFFDRLARKFVLNHFQEISIGKLTIEECGQKIEFGESSDDSHIKATIRVNSPAAYRSMLTGGSVGGGEAYAENLWDSPDLTSVIQIMAVNIDALRKMEKKWPLFSKLSSRLMYFFQRNNKTGSRKNISAHYDLSNQFFSLFLDPTMMYSSAIYPFQDATLDQASIHKLDTICQKLQLSEQDHLIEIGTGWGGLAIHAASNYGCKVTTTTISQEQHNYAKKKIDELGLNDKITLLLKDYRDLEGNYDKLVSIEMIEAVGHQYFDNYFEKCSSLIKPDGLALIQAITIKDQFYERAKNSVDFIKAHIFPGGCLPSTALITNKLAKVTDFNLIGFQDITMDYADTLRDWRLKFDQQHAKMEELGFDEFFRRLWRYYFAYCEGGFRERSIGTAQYLFAKPRFRT